MATSAGRLIRSVAHLAPGEGLSRLCSVATVIYLGHRYGVVILGVYALAVTLSVYLQPIIDFGLRHIGARLMAQQPQSADEIIRRVQYRRLRMAALVLPFLAIYAVAVKLPVPMKVFLLVFSFSSALYAVSLDWAAWGKNQLHLLGFARAIVPLSILVFVLAGRAKSVEVLWWAAAGNLFGYLVQAGFFWIWWRQHQPDGPGPIGEQISIAESLAWRRTSIMGLAWLSNLAFNSIDMLMLGLMSNPLQVGLYGAAYRVLNQVLGGYYLLTQSMYPELSRQNPAQRIRMLRPKILLSLLAIGVAAAGAMVMVRRPLITLLFGNHFVAASSLLFLLAWAVPLDFVTSYLGNAYIAWGMERKILLCTAIGAGSNILLNFFWIPIYGAAAAAVDTLLSYVIFLISLVLVGRFAKELSRDREPIAEPA
jgi:O-antigen/teichoic acid export membrane protein